MFQIADRILSLSDIDRPVRKHLDVFTMQKSVFLLCNHIGDAGFLRVEVISDFLHRICGFALFHHRLSLPFACKSIQSTACINSSGLHIILHIICRKFQIIVLYGDVTIIVNLPLSVGKNFHD